MCPSATPPPLERTRIADQILRDLKLRIVSGDFPVGAKLPTERELTEQYGVSGSTVREAIRGLTAVGLAEVRHGSGAYVTADVQGLIAGTLGTVIRLQGAGAADVLTIFTALFGEAAAAASERATPEDIEALVGSLQALEGFDSAATAAAAAQTFHNAIAAATHNPLLAALYRVMATLQVELAAELTGEDLAAWRRIIGQLNPARRKLVHAIIAHDRAAASQAAQTLQRRATDFLTAPGLLDRQRQPEPVFEGLVASMMNGGA